MGHDTDCKTRLSVSSYGFVTSPLYPFNYKAEVECLQTIVVPSGENVMLTFESIEVEDYYGVCYYDWVKVSSDVIVAVRDVTGPLFRCTMVVVFHPR